MWFHLHYESAGKPTMGVEVQDPASPAPTAPTLLPPGILAAVIVPATSGDDVELIASDGPVPSTILMPALLRALTAADAA